MNIVESIIASKVSNVTSSELLERISDTINEKVWVQLESPLSFGIHNQIKTNIRK